MLGAIAGDIIGSVYEANNIKTRDFPLFGPLSTFTDDTVCTLAIAECLMAGGGDFAGHLRAFVRRHPRRGYGSMFFDWAMSDGVGAYNSWGNGSAMRVGPVAYAAGDEAEVLELAARSSSVTHSHPDAVAGAQAVALAMWLARRGSGGHPPVTGKKEIARTLGERFGYDLSESVDSIRRWYAFDVSARGSVPQAIVCALEADDYEGAVRNAVSIGGDSDTIACIAGGLAEALHGLPSDIGETAFAALDDDLRDVVDRFHERYLSSS